MTRELLRKVAPAEAKLLDDPSVTAVVRLRFGGSVFPPTILFKVFLSSRAGRAVKYLCGRNMIRPASKVGVSLARVPVL